MAKPIYEQIEVYLNHCRSHKQSKMTISSKDHTYRHFVVESEATDLRKLDNEAFDRWLAAESERGVSVRTINTRMAHILAMIRYYREMGMEMPIKLPMIKKLKDKNPPRRVFYTRDEINYVLNEAEDLEWLLIKIGFDTGMRISEIRNMRLKEITDRRINFIGKGSKGRESYMSEEARQRLDEWIDERGVTDYLWARRSGLPYSVDEIRVIMRNAFHRAAKTLETAYLANKSPFDDAVKVADRLRKFYPHSLRHSFGSDLQASGADLLEMQQMMGHEDAATTQRYLHGLDGHLAGLFDKYKAPEAIKRVTQVPQFDTRVAIELSKQQLSIEAKMDRFMDGMLAMQDVLEKMQKTR